MSVDTAAAPPVALAERVYLWCGSAYRMTYQGRPFDANEHIVEGAMALSTDDLIFKHGHVCGIGGADSDDEAYARTRRLLRRLCPHEQGWRSHLVTIRRQEMLEQFVTLANLDWSRPEANIALGDGWEA
jgi:hypothetical protein